MQGDIKTALKDSDYQVTFTFLDGTIPINFETVVSADEFITQFQNENVSINDFYDVDVTFTTKDKFFEDFLFFCIPDSGELVNAMNIVNDPYADGLEDEDLENAAKAWMKVIG